MQLHFYPLKLLHNFTEKYTLFSFLRYFFILVCIKISPSHVSEKKWTFIGPSARRFLSPSPASLKLLWPLCQSLQETENQGQKLHFSLFLHLAAVLTIQKNKTCAILELGCSIQPLNTASPKKTQQLVLPKASRSGVSWTRCSQI